MVFRIPRILSVGIRQSISLNPDSVLKTLLMVAEVEGVKA
jgi:hypothetical protein